MKFQELIASLTMKEWHIVEQKSGMGMGVLGDESSDTPRASFYMALAWVIKKRTEAGFKWEDAENLRLEEVNEILGLNEAAATQEEELDLENDES